MFNQNQNNKQLQSSNSLYTQLKQALNAEKQAIRTEHKKHVKKRVLHTSQNHKQQLLSQSLNLNDVIIGRQEKSMSMSLALDLSKAQVGLTTPLTPYQEQKQQKCSKIQFKPAKNRSYFEFYKKKQPQSTKTLSVKEKRAHNFFNGSKTKTKTQQSQNEQNLTYSVILKSIKDQQTPNAQQNIFAQQHQPSSKIGFSHQNLPEHKCERCLHQSYHCPSIFFKKEEIQKNISLIEEMKNSLNQLDNQTDSRHFPEVEVLNFSYFNEKKKKVINKLNSRQGLNSLSKMRLFVDKKKSSGGLPCSKCKSMEKNAGKNTEKFLTNPHNFQYFVYEYKPTGQITKTKRSQSVSQSSMYVKKTKPHYKSQSNTKNTKNIKNQRMNTTVSVNLNNAFQEFIVHNKITLPPRPYTAAVKTSQEIWHFRNPHPCANNENQQSFEKQANEQNFVKPWQSQTEVDNFF